MNINIFYTIKSLKNATDYTNMLATNVFFSLITLPTRIADTSSTVIDNVINNDHKSLIHPGIIKTDLTDHSPINCLILIPLPHMYLLRKSKPTHV